MSNSWKLITGIILIGLTFWTGVGLIIGLIFIAWYITSEREYTKRKKEWEDYYRYWYQNQYQQ